VSAIVVNLAAWRDGRDQGRPRRPDSILKLGRPAYWRFLGSGRPWQVPSATEQGNGRGDLGRGRSSADN